MLCSVSIPAKGGLAYRRSSESPTLSYAPSYQQVQRQVIYSFGCVGSTSKSKNKTQRSKYLDRIATVAHISHLNFLLAFSKI